MGRELVNEEIFSVTAIILNLFTNLTIGSFYGLGACAMLMVIFRRIHTLYEMEEFEETRDQNCKYDEVKIDIKDATFSWDFKLKEEP